MKAVKCACCGGSMKRNGKTSSGAQRWRCAACGASATVRYDDAAARLEEFLSWLLSKDTQLEMPGAGRTFRRRTSEFWEVWPMPVPDGELHRVLFVDGIWLAERLVVLICCSGERYLDWCGFWADFLEDTTLVDGRRVYTHERLRKARRSLSSLVSAGTLFTYLDPGLTKAGPLPSTNNRIEGGVNAQLRAVLRNHRGLTSLKRVKAVFWWCHAHSGDARTAREKLATMPRDADIDLLYDVYSSSPKQGDGRPEWGDRAVWEELHRKDPFPFWLD